MTKKLKLLSSAILGSTFTLESSMGTAFAPPVEFINYGNNATGPVATSLISLDLSEQQIAPDSIGCKPNFAVLAPLLGLPAPTGAGSDRIIMECEYFWFFSHGAPYSKMDPERTPDVWLNSLMKLGAHVRHMVRDPVVGMTIDMTVYHTHPVTKAVTVVSAEQVTHTVKDPFDEIPASEQFIIQPEGETDFSDMLALFPNAQTFNLPVGNIINDQKLCGPNDHFGGVGRLYILNGAFDYQMSLEMDSGNPTNSVANFIFTSANGRAKVAPYWWDGTDNRILEVTNNYIGRTEHQSRRLDIRFTGMDFVGEIPGGVTKAFDPRVYTRITAPDDVAGRAIRLLRPINLILDDVSFNGFKNGCINAYANSPHAPAVTHYNDFTFVNYGGEYPIFTGPDENPESWFAMTGYRLYQEPDVPEVPDAPARIWRSNDMQYTYVDCADHYTPDRDNTCIKVVNTPKSQRGQYVVVSRFVAEGMNRVVSIAENSGQGIGNGVFNVEFNSVILLAHHDTTTFVATTSGGAVFRNILMVVPDSATDHPFIQIAQHLDFSTKGQSPGFADSVFDFVNCTFDNRRTPLNNTGNTGGSKTPSLTQAPMPFAVNFKDCVFLGSWNANDVPTPDAAADYSTGLISVPMSDDWIDDLGGISYPEYGSPLDSVQERRPLIEGSLTPTIQFDAFGQTGRKEKGWLRYEA